MVDMTQIAYVVAVHIWRHAGDMDSGNTNSWFPEVTVRVLGSDKEPVEVKVTLNATRKHGFTREQAHKLGGQILTKGKINLKLWHTCT